MLQNATSDFKGGFPPNVPKPTGRFRAKKKRESTHQRSHTLDLKKIAAWAQVGCTRDEMADLLSVDRDWFNHAISQDYGLEEAVLTGFSNFKASLRSVQAKLALSGHPGMLIWLGKQFLGQSDKQESRQETTVNIVLQNAMKELRDLDAGTLVQMKILMEKKEPLLIENGS